jgi:hypothetical protein
VKDGLSSLPTLKTMPERDEDPSSSGSDDIDYSMFDDIDTEAAGDQPSGQQRSGTEASASTAGERTLAALGKETLARATPTKGQAGLGCHPPANRREPAVWHELQGARGSVSWALLRGKYFFVCSSPLVGSLVPR